MANAWSHAAWVEIAATLACSTTGAKHLVEVGEALRKRLPKTRAAFANAVDEVLMRDAPDEYAELRKDSSGRGR